MKKVKNLLALLMAAIMIFSVAVPEAFARGDYEKYQRDEQLNNVGVFEFTPEQAATYLLDMVDQMLGDSELNLEIDASVTDIYLDFSSIDRALFTVYHVVRAVAGGHTSSAEQVLSKLSGAVGLLKIFDFDDLENLSVESLDIGGTSVNTGRAIPASTFRSGVGNTITVSRKAMQIGGEECTDLPVLYELLDFLADNGPILSKLATGDFSLGNLGDWIIDLVGGDVGEIFTNLDGWLKNMLYESVWSDGGEAMPAGWTYDQGIQDIVNWALIKGTADANDTSYAGGAKSILGENFEPFLPEMLVGYDANGNQVASGASVIGNAAVAYTNGGASIGTKDAYTGKDQIKADRANGQGLASYDMGMYQLVNNAIVGLLNGMVYDLLKDVLYDALDIYDLDEIEEKIAAAKAAGDIALVAQLEAEYDETEADVTGELVYSMLVGTPQAPGLIYSLLVQNGAEEINWDVVENKPKPMVTRLLDWLIKEGGLFTFINIDYKGITVTDNFMSLLYDLLDLVPTLALPLLGMTIPPYMEKGDLSKAKVSEEYGNLYLTWKDANGKQYELYTTDTDADPVQGIKPTSYCYVGNGDGHDPGQHVNISDPSAPDYHNPDLIKVEYEMPVAEKWAYILKIALNSFVEGCYFPEYADEVGEDSVSAVGAYALAALAAKYIPENNYWDRLDKYYWYEIAKQPGKFKSRSGADAETIKALPWTETMEIKKLDGSTLKVEVPRAALDIGAAIGSFFLAGVWDFESTIGYSISADTNKTFEELLMEVCFWGLSKYATAFVGQFNKNTGTFSEMPVSANVQQYTGQTTTRAMWRSFLQTAYNGMYESNGKFRNLTSQEQADLVYGLIDNTLFKLIPGTWFPTWMSETTSASASLFENFLFNSIMHIDLQKIFSLLQSNDLTQLIDLNTGELVDSKEELSKNASGDVDYFHYADLQNSLTDVLVQLVYKVLGFVFGGCNALPAYTFGSSYTSHTRENKGTGNSAETRRVTQTYYNVFTNPSSVRSFEALLSGESLKTLLQNLLDLLDWYAPSICISFLPLIVSIMVGDTVKDYNYENSENIHYLDSAFANNELTIDDLKNYLIEFTTAENGHFLGEAGEAERKVNFRKLDAATTAIEYAGLEITEDNPGYQKVKVDGVTYYQVEFPTEYDDSVKAANAASNFVNGSVIRSTSVNGGNVFKIFIGDDYRTQTATESVVKVDSNGNVTSGTAANTYYTYSPLAGTTGKFTLAVANTDPSTGKLRTGTRGEVTFPATGYRLNEAEDYTGRYISLHNNSSDAQDSAEDFISDYESFIQQDLPEAYGDWLAYLVQMRLQDKGLYTLSENPKVPSSMYPFMYNNKDIYTAEWTPNKCGTPGIVQYDVAKQNQPHYYFFEKYGPNCGLDVINQAVAYGNRTQVPLDGYDKSGTPVIGSRTLEMMSLCLGKAVTLTDGKIALTDSEKTTIGVKCQDYGCTFNSTTNIITRKAFAYITDSYEGGNYFGVYGNPKTFGTMTQEDLQNSIFLAPGFQIDDMNNIGKYLTGAEDKKSDINDIWTAYKEFAENVDAMNKGLYNHYDELSSTTVAAEQSSTLRAIDVTSLEWILNYTLDAYIDPNVDSRQTNKAMINKKVASKDESGNITTTTKYSKETFDAFQKAFDYGTELLDYIKGAYKTGGFNTGKTKLRQALITKAYQEILKAYYNLKERSGFCDWDSYIKTLETAESILKGPLGFTNYDAVVAGQAGETPEYGYSVESLTNLYSAFKNATDFYNQNVATFDDESQDIVNEEREKVQSVIDALEFKEAVGEADIVLVEEGVITEEDKAVPEKENEAFIKHTTDEDGVKSVYLTGLKEGFGLGYYLAEDGSAVKFETLYRPTGINIYSETIPAGFNYLDPSGDGTGSKLSLTVNGIPRVEYIAVLFGDLNGDARIDGVDKSNLEVRLMANNFDKLDKSILYAADVSNNGSIGYEDVALIYNHYNSVNEIQQNRVIMEFGN